MTRLEHLRTGIVRRWWLTVLAGLVLTCGPFAAPARAARLHVVLAVDRKAERVGRDLTAFVLMGSLGANIPSANLEVYWVDETSMSEPAILNAVRRVPVEPDDALMFLYVGHGVYDETLGTCMTPSASTGQVKLSATKMVQVLQALGPRLAVVLIDCCNRERAPNPTTVRVPAPGQPPQQISPLFDELFFRTKGAVLVVSSSKGEYALVRAYRDDDPASPEPPVGPLFTNALGNTLDNNQGQRLLWPQLIDRTQDQLHRYFDLMTDPGGRITLDDGTEVQQNQQTIQLRIFK